MASTSNYPNTFKASAYGLDEAKLYTNLNQEDQWIDIRTAIAEITIIESIFNAGISVQIQVVDTRSILEALKIIGNEKIKLTISREDIVSGEKKSFELNLFLAEVGNYSRTNPGKQSYTLTCVSEHVYNNQFQTLKYPFSGSIGNTIEQVCKSNLKIDKEKLEINKEVGSVKGIFPRIKPLSAINWLLLNAYDGETPCFFFETVSENKIKLQSLKEMIDGDVYETYTFEPFLQHSIANPDLDAEALYLEEKRKIQAISSELNMSKLKSVAEGSYGAKLHVIDIHEKTSTPFEYKYKRTVKLNEHDPFSKTTKFLDKTLPNQPEGKNYFLSKNSKAFGNDGNYHTPNEPTIMAANAYLKNLNTQTVEITIAGDFDLYVGKKVEIQVQRVGAEKEDGDPNDVYFSGNYVVTQIQHLFNTEYNAKVKLKKDSFMESVDDILQIKHEEEDTDA